MKRRVAFHDRVDVREAIRRQTAGDLAKRRKPVRDAAGVELRTQAAVTEWLLDAVAAGLAFVPTEPCSNWDAAAGRCRGHGHAATVEAIGALEAFVGVVDESAKLDASGFFLRMAHLAKAAKPVLARLRAQESAPIGRISIPASAESTAKEGVPAEAG